MKWLALLLLLTGCFNGYPSKVTIGDEIFKFDRDGDVAENLNAATYKSQEGNTLFLVKGDFEDGKANQQFRHWIRHMEAFDFKIQNDMALGRVRDHNMYALITFNQDYVIHLTPFNDLKTKNIDDVKEIFSKLKNIKYK